MKASANSEVSVAAKQAALAALCSQEFGSKPVDASTSVPASIHSDASGEGHRAFYFAGDELASLGGAVRWALVQGASELHLLSQDGVGNDIARRADYLETPFSLHVWALTGGAFAPLQPTALAPLPTLPASHRAFAPLIEEAGARAVDDHGRLIAEVKGLEVARVTEITPSPDDCGSTLAVLEIGVGQADRELHQMIHVPAADALEQQADHDALLPRLTKVVDDVNGMRDVVGDHPLRRVGQQRWIRSILLDRPEIVGASALTAEPPLRPRDTVLGTEASAATGALVDGAPVVVVCTAGVDLDIAAEAGDYLHRANKNAQLIVVAPERDLYLVDPIVSEVLPGVRVLAAPGL